MFANYLSLVLFHEQFLRADLTVRTDCANYVDALLRMVNLHAVDGEVFRSSRSAICHSGCRDGIEEAFFVEVLVDAVKPFAIGRQGICGVNGGASHSVGPFASIRIAAHAFVSIHRTVSEAVAPSQVGRSKRDALVLFVGELESCMQLAKRVNLVCPYDIIAVSRNDG